MKTEDFKDLIRPIVYKYGSGWLLDKPEMLEEICKKYHSEQLLIHSVVVPKGTCCLNPKRISHVTVDGITHSTCENCTEEIV